ncbi:RNA polymerase sigma factor [Trema orientale]|uniref:RNA polymerase sigma factor n=1 Tax=Trema orientale TaxID=63057 RepID=A0A2P5BL36_TREOI|nr:RNA polymerase sigma factor [Trema orientale]
MMATAAVIGLSTGKRLLSSSSYYSDITEKLSFVNDHIHGYYYYQFSSAKNMILARKSSNYTPSFPSSNRHEQSHSIRALKDHVDAPSSSTSQPWFQVQDSNDLEEESSALGYSVDALLLLQKSMLEKQWSLSFERKVLPGLPARRTNINKIPVTCSGVSARQRRINARKKTLSKPTTTITTTTTTTPPTQPKHMRPISSPELFQNRFKGYVKGIVGEDLLTHAEVVQLSQKIKIGLSLEEHKSRLKDRLGCEPSDEQLATSLRITRAELQSKLIESSLAREQLAMSNVRLVMSIAQRYDNMGAEMADLVQGGLIGLLRGIEKFDSSKGFRISTYVYWWIRQGVSRALVENSRTLRLPTHLHERLSSIKNAKIKLEEKGITPSIDRIAECLNMSKKKVRNATEAISKVFSLDREAFPSLNGLPGETHHSYIADNCLENIPWHGVDDWALKDEVNKLINTTLGERERDIIRLYYGLDNECLTWEDISKRIGLSRERVRQVGLVALEKLKHAARRKKLEAMLVKH